MKWATHPEESEEDVAYNAYLYSRGLSPNLAQLIPPELLENTDPSMTRYE